MTYLLGIDVETPWRELSPQVQQWLLFTDESIEPPVVEIPVNEATVNVVDRQHHVRGEGGGQTLDAFVVGRVEGADAPGVGAVGGDGGQEPASGDEVERHSCGHRPRPYRIGDHDRGR